MLKNNDKIVIYSKKLALLNFFVYFCTKRMATKEDVERFLSEFHIKLSVFGIIFRDDRGKNMQTLLELEITPKYREDIIKGLNAEDFVDGPVPDTLNKLGDMWVFGRDIKGRDVYIKISMGIADNSTICISFHIAEHKLKYKFKK